MLSIRTSCADKYTSLSASAKRGDLRVRRAANPAAQGAQEARGCAQLFPVRGSPRLFCGHNQATGGSGVGQARLYLCTSCPGLCSSKQGEGKAGEYLQGNVPAAGTR